MRERWNLAVAVAAGVLGVSGCGASTPWQRTASGPMSVQPAPVVFVRQVIASGAPDRAAQLNREEMTEILLQSLKTEGIHAVTAANASGPVDYILTCAASQVGYAVRGGYPRRVNQGAALACSISHPDTGGVHWQRQLHRDNDLTRVINTMTKLPSRHDVELLQQCVLPVWDGMAYGVRLFLERPAPLARHAKIADAAVPGDSSRALVQDVERWREEQLRGATVPTHPDDQAL